MPNSEFTAAELRDQVVHLTGRLGHDSQDAPVHVHATVTWTDAPGGPVVIASGDTLVGQLDLASFTMDATLDATLLAGRPPPTAGARLTVVGVATSVWSSPLVL